MSKGNILDYASTRQGDSAWTAGDDFCSKLLVPLMISFSSAMLQNNVNKACNLLLEIHGSTYMYILNHYNNMNKEPPVDAEGKVIKDGKKVAPVPPDFNTLIYDVQQSLVGLKMPEDTMNMDNREYQTEQYMTQIITAKRNLDKIRQRLYYEIREILLPLIDHSKKKDITKTMRE